MNHKVSFEIYSSAPICDGLNISFTKFVRDMTIVKQHEQKNIEVKVFKNSSSKLYVSNYIAPKNKVASCFFKVIDGSYLEEVLSDLERDDEIRMKAVLLLKDSKI